jgi:hypothetical protein
MSERIVINTGPPIALGRMQAFSVIEQLPYEFCCPLQVETGMLNGAAIGHLPPGLGDGAGAASGVSGACLNCPGRW